jgi:hypothetical protein
MPFRPLLLLLPLLLPAVAHADAVCIARADAPFVPKAPEAERPAPVGTLEKRACYPVVERLTDRTRIWVSAPDGFQGEVEVKNDDLLQVLLDDVDLRDEKDGELWGRVLSGTGVVVEGQAGGGMLRVKPVEGRVDVGFLVAASDIYFGQNWPEPDPDDVADPPWPEATLPVPPTKTELRSPDGRVTRARIRPAIFGVHDLLLDPARGELRFAREPGEHDAAVTVVAPTMWLKGTTSSLDWREDPPAGWPPDQGIAAPPAAATGNRQVGDNAADIAAEAKGTAFGALQPGARLTVVTEEKGWMQVTAPWAGGRVQGWIEKKRLFKEGKETPYTAPVQPVAHISLGHTTVRWANEAGHVAPPEDPEFVPHELLLTVDPLQKVLLDDGDGLRLAWARVLQTAPDAKGEAALRVLVAPSGELLEVGFPKTTLGAEEINKRLVELAGTAVFEERKPPKKKKRSDPDLDWNIEVWVQLTFAGS